jgi:predicted glycogen debranching enzyme
MPGSEGEGGELPPPITISAERLHDFDEGSRLEWLESDGLGGYASSTATGANTRRYHGLLVVARRPPADRIVLLSRIEETVITPTGERFELGANYYPGAVHPHGYRYLDSFRLDPWPIWRYRLGALTLTRVLFLAREPGAVVLLYRLEGGEAQLELRPLVAGRDFHALVRENQVVSPTAEAAPGRVVYHPYPGVPPLVLSHDGGEWHDEGRWYRRTRYPREAERGLDHEEDLYSPGALTAPLTAGGAWRLACATEPVAVRRAAAWAAEERRRRQRVAGEGGRAVAGDPALTELAARLGLAGDTFLVRRGEELSILAGYPWFADWGRDAMISIPGLCLVTGRPDHALSVLRTFAAHMRDGLIPNRFPDYGGPIPDDHYNAADASLWFVEAVAATAVAGGDVADLWPAVQAVLEAYRTGTRFGIGIDKDGLVRQGARGVQLTWMDACVNGWVVTPRAGKAVEINALWYNALERAARLATSQGDEPEPYRTLASRARAGFAAFWDEAAGYLYDRIDPAGHPDSTLRPNQLFAVSLPHSPLGVREMRGVVDSVERYLLVPLAVRTLAPGHPDYHGRFEGSRAERDAAYHSGTAWPWLLGPFAAAYLRAYGVNAESRRRLLELLAPLRAHLLEQGLGQIAEVISGDPPYRPGGCFAQAWSCAELLRALSLIARSGEDRPGGD